MPSFLSQSSDDVQTLSISGNLHVNTEIIIVILNPKPKFILSN